MLRYWFAFILGTVLCSNLAAHAQEVCLPLQERGVYEEVPYVVQWNVRSNCGTKAKNDLKKRRDAYQAELDRCSVAVPTPTPTPLPSPSPSPTVNPELQTAIALWEQRLIERIDWHHANPLQTGSSRWHDEHKNVIYYEGAHVFRRAQLYLTGVGKSATALKAKAISDRLVTEYATIAWPAYRTGSQWAFARTAEMHSDALLLHTAEFNSYWYDDGLSDAVAGNDARGLAYYLASIARLKQRGIAVNRGHQISALTSATESYLNTLPHNFDLFYMMAQLGNVLLDYEETLTPYIDARARATQIADYIRPYVETSGALRYGTGYLPVYINGQEVNEVELQYNELHLLIAPLFAKLGDRETAQKLFVYGVNQADLITNAKAVPQNYLYSFDLVEILSE